MTPSSTTEFVPERCCDLLTITDSANRPTDKGLLRSLDSYTDMGSCTGGREGVQFIISVSGAVKQRGELRSLKDADEDSGPYGVPHPHVSETEPNADHRRTYEVDDFVLQGLKSTAWLRLHLGEPLPVGDSSRSWCGECGRDDSVGVAIRAVEVTTPSMGNSVRGVLAFVPLERCQHYLVGDLKEMPLDRVADLSSRQLQRFPMAVCAFGELLRLYLSENRLQTLPPELHGLQQLQLLALDFNSLEELPLVVCRLPQLNTLYLGSNRLRRLPRELGQLKELRTLWVEANCLCEFPQVLCELPNLRTLHLGYNRLRSLPRELVQLGELRSIWLEGNLLTEFPPVLLDMHLLDVIDVDRNRIRHFPSLVHLRGLKLVIYDHNPCINAPAVAEGVRRVGRWADCTDDSEEEEEAAERRAKAGAVEDVAAQEVPAEQSEAE
ncbi:Leucine rich repeat containing 10-like [Scleropages formosus]|uniref:Leucine rich repeat containing 10-like n=2 Tax=Scleropages formosus TaxID=113540 RepID=A0A0P7WGI7_SCLFO|nr:Leucine rich repeat containing 10-like [Scleropages formosus]